MTDEAKEKMYEKDQFEYEFYQVLKENLKKAEEKDKWLVENYNKTNRHFSERLTWMAGIGIALFRLVLKPESIGEERLVIISIFLLFISILLGVLDFFFAQSFWKRNVEKNKEAIEIWYEGMLDIHKEYPNNEQTIYDRSLKRIADLELNKNAAALNLLVVFQAIVISISIFLLIIYFIAYTF